MNNKDLESLMEAYDAVATPDASAALSPELSQIASTEVQSTSEGDNEQEKISMVNTNLKTATQHLLEIEKAINSGKNVEPWMQEKIAIASDSIVRVANAILNRE